MTAHPHSADATSKAKRTQPREYPFVPEAPSVWRHGGYMVLVTDVDLEREEAYFFNTLSMKREMLRLKDFVIYMKAYAQTVNPYRLALNLLSRLRDGTMMMRVREERRMVEMLNREHLAGLSERELGNEYRRIMGKGPQKIPTASKEKYIDEMLDRLKADAAKPSETEGNGEDKEASAPKPRKVKKEKNKEPKVRKPREPKIKKERDPNTPSRQRIPKILTKGPTRPQEGNPYREGSMKNQAFELFLKVNGDREKTVEGTIKLGATPATASSWYSRFCKDTGAC